MFLKKKKQKKPVNNETRESQGSATLPKKKIVVHTMPGKPIIKSSPKKEVGVNIVVFIVIFVVVGGLASYFLKDYLFPAKPDRIVVSSANDVVDDTKGDTIKDVNNDIVIDDVVDEEEPITLPRNDIDDDIDIEIKGKIDLIDDNDDDNINRNIDPSDIEVVPYAQDRDGDIMTDVEESLYGTDIDISDTDNDGFLDGQEIANLYNPIKPGSAKIIDSGLVKIYTNPLYKYSIFYPSSWRVVPLSGGDQEITFVSETKEFVEVAVMDNPMGLTASEWYLGQISEDLIDETEVVWANNFMGISSFDKMHVYLTPISGDRNFIYHISYMVGSHTNISYPGTFQMMVGSFDFR